MRAELRASLEGLMQEHDRQLEQLREMREKLREVSATARSKDGMVTVVVGPGGQVRDIRLGDRVYERLSTAKLSRKILELIDTAGRDVADRTRELAEPFVTEGQPLAEIVGRGAAPAAPPPRPAPGRRT